MYYFNAMNKAKKISVLFLAVASAVLGGCSSLTNLSPESVPENASRIYTLSMSAYINDGSLVKDSIEPFIVIDEQVIPMKEVKDMKYDRIYEYDYVMPKGRKDAKYYFMLKYKVDNTVKGVREERVIKSRTVYELKPVSRYVVNIQTSAAQLVPKSRFWEGDLTNWIKLLLEESMPTRSIFRAQL